MINFVGIDEMSESKTNSYSYNLLMDIKHISKGTRRKLKPAKQIMRNRLTKYFLMSLGAFKLAKLSS